MGRKITLIRHGQAGDRIVYDQLSSLGLRQSEALGRWFASRGTQFDLVVAGALQRKQTTAAAITSKTGHPEILTDPRWDEFDLDAVYSGMAPHLCRDDPKFRSEYEELRQDMEDPAHSVHRNWRNCDTTAVKAWMGGTYSYEGESFPAFLDRIASALDGLPEAGSVAVVTSATPIGICCARALDLSQHRTMSMAAALHNTGYSEFLITGSGLRLSSFNNAPHLPENWITHR